MAVPFVFAAPCRGGRPCPPDLRPILFFLFWRKKRTAAASEETRCIPFPAKAENFISAGSFFLSESRPLRWVAFRLILEKKENIQNRKCKPCRHRVRRSQLHSVSAGAAKAPYPQPSSSFPNCDRFTGSQFGHLEFYNAARYLDDGGHLTSCGYATSCRGGQGRPPLQTIS